MTVRMSVTVTNRGLPIWSVTREAVSVLAVKEFTAERVTNASQDFSAFHQRVVLNVTVIDEERLMPTKFVTRMTENALALQALVVASAISA